MGKNQKDEQDLETDGRDSEETDGDQLLDVIIQERLQLAEGGVAGGMR